MREKSGRKEKTGGRRTSVVHGKNTTIAYEERELCLNRGEHQF